MEIGEASTLSILAFFSLHNQPQSNSFNLLIYRSSQAPLPYITLQHMMLYYSALNHTTVHYIILQYFGLHYSTLHHNIRATPHHTTPQHTTAHYTTTHYSTLRHNTLQHITPHYTTHTTTRYVTTHYSTIQHTTPQHTTAQHTTSHYTTTHYTTAHYTTLYHNTLHHNTLHHNTRTTSSTGLPDEHGRLQILKIHTAMMKKMEKMHPDVSLEQLAAEVCDARNVWMLKIFECQECFIVAVEFLLIAFIEISRGDVLICSEMFRRWSNLIKKTSDARTYRRKTSAERRLRVW